MGRRAYTFHVTFDDDSAVAGCAELRRLAAEYQRALTPLNDLDLVPLRWLHLTMQNVGFTDEVSDQEVESALKTARTMCRDLPSFDLSFDTAEVWREAIVMRPRPAEPIAQLRDTVRAALSAARREEPEAPEHAHGFQPHVSVAYSTREGPSEPFAEAIREVDAHHAIVTVRAAKLIILDRDERVYRWEAYGAVALGTPG